jgi:glycosyltransferase involved in cell wall biosynthesis
MRFHLLGLSHTRTTKEFSCCAFTQKVRLLSKMLTDLGHTVYHYGTEGSDPVCTENVTVLSDSCWRAVHGDRNWKRDGFNVSLDTAAWRQFNARCKEEITKRVQDRDFILCNFGHAHQTISQFFPRCITVEPGIGYPITFAKYRVFESYAWMHYHYGKEGKECSPEWYDAVIPNSLDLADFPFESKKENYMIFVGRLSNTNKGFGIADDVCRRLGIKLYLAGQGGPIPGMQGEYLGVLSIEDRAKWVSKARAAFVPTYYIEPFGTTNIEAQAYGTPVICTDFGAFTETVIHGLTGFRCRTFEQFMWAAQHIDEIDPNNCRKHAEKYSIYNAGRMYEEYFANLQRLFADNQGWYYMPVQRSKHWLLMNGVFNGTEQGNAANKFFQFWRDKSPFRRKSGSV